MGDKLYVALVNQSRIPVFYTQFGVADEIGARFELLTFHVGLIISCLKSVPKSDPRCEQAAETAQGVFDAFLLALDSTLREQGTGDLTVPKKMKALGTIVYTRMKRWDDLWETGADKETQADYALRTIYAGLAYGGMPDPDDSVPVLTEGEEAQEKRDEQKSLPWDKILAFAQYADGARKALNLDNILIGNPNLPRPEAYIPGSAQDAEEEIVA